MGSKNKHEPDKDTNVPVPDWASPLLAYHFSDHGPAFNISVDDGDFSDGTATTD